jgi:hypothetical protein
MEENEFLNDDPYDGLEDPVPQDDEGIDEENPDVESSEEDEGMHDVGPGDPSSYEYELSKAYDAIVAAGDLSEAVYNAIAANPINTNSVIVAEKTKEFLNLQGKTRVPSDTAPGLLKGKVVESGLNDDDSEEINERKEREAKDLIWRFIKFLTERDLSKDNAANRRRKLRHLPAFIIYLFASKLYGLLIGCPYLPKEYSEQIDNALVKISEKKYQLLDELIKKYEEAGSNEIAEKVKRLKLRFFDYEPADLRASVEFRDITIKDNDIVIYKSVRNRFINITKSITQETASDLIEVVIDKDAGISEKLKDKVRTQSVDEVKRLFRDFSEDSAKEGDNEVAIDILLHD